MDGSIEIPLQALVILDDWRDADIGKLLIIRRNVTGSEVGFRCHIEAANGVSPGLLLVGGDYSGKLVTSEFSGPAIDVTDLFEITAVDPCPLLPTENDLVVGMLCSYCAEKTAHLVWSETLTGSFSGFICIGGDHPQYPIGSYHIGAPSRVAVAKLIRVRPRPISN